MWKSIVGRLVEAIHPVHEATTPEERAGIARMRYDIYVAEQKDRHPQADHERREIWTADDDAPWSHHLYVGPIGQPVGSLKLRVWQPGEIPADKKAYYSMDVFPTIDQRVVCDVTALMFRKGLRGTATVPGLTTGAARMAVEAHGTELIFATCSPGHLPSYRTLGLRPFGGALISDTYSVLIPLIGVINDLEHLRRSRSPWYPAMRKLQREGRLPTTDLSGYREHIAKRDSVVIDSTDLTNELGTIKEVGDSSFLELLPEKARAKLADAGFAIDIERETSVVQAGSADQEMYVILDGRFEARQDGRPLRVMSRGELFGELAFLGRSRTRTAEVVAVTHGRVLVIRRSFLTRLRQSDPQTAIDIYESLASALAARFIAR